LHLDYMGEARSPHQEKRIGRQGKCGGYYGIMKRIVTKSASKIEVFSAMTDYE
jgi:hypothetical protein